jgi:SOS-response transcriptional repressor LexA
MILTKRQREILDSLHEFTESKGFAPTIQEIGSRFRPALPATVHKHLEQIRDGDSI